MFGVSVPVTTTFVVALGATMIATLWRTLPPSSSATSIDEPSTVTFRSWVDVPWNTAFASSGASVGFEIV